jgi:hypothetical protein
MSAFERGEAQIVPGTVSVRPIGTNYQITALIEAGGDRRQVYIYATDCQDGHARYIWDGNISLGTLAQDALLTGTTPKDKMFTQLCNEGLPLAHAMNDKVTPEQRAATRWQ